MLFVRGRGEAAPALPFEIPYATRAEADAGVLTDKVMNPDVTAYAYDRFRYPGQHAAGKGTRVVVLTPNAGVVTITGQRSNVFSLTLTESVHFANPVAPIDGQTINILLRQNEIGGHDATFDDQWEFTNRINPTLTPDANARDLLSCQWDPIVNKMCCSFLPNFGSGYTPPDTPDFEDFNFVNVGGGNEVFRDIVGTDINLRTIVGGGDVEVTTDGDNIVVSYTAPVGEVENIGDLGDVDVVTEPPAVGDTLTFDGENWVPARPRTWSIGATWTNGNNVLGTPVNEVNSVVSEPAILRGWYLLTSGGSGSCEVDVRRSTFGSFPPYSSDSLCGGVEPSISFGTANSDTELDGWTTQLNEGDILQFVLLSVSTFKTVQIILILERDN
jgi:hypothetical protein